MNIYHKDYTLSLNRFLLANLYVFLIQYLGLMFSFFASPLAPIWLASGTACGMVFLRGYRILLGIWLGCFIAFYFANAGFLISCVGATFSALQSFLIVYLTRFFITATLIFYQRKLFFLFIIVTLTITAMRSYLLMTLLKIEPILFGMWWLANALGVIVIGSALIAWDAYFPQWQPISFIRLFIYSLVFILMVIAVHYYVLAVAFIILSTIFITRQKWLWCEMAFALLILNLIFSFSFYLHPLDNIHHALSLEVLLLIQAIIGLVISARHPPKRAKLC